MPTRNNDENNIIDTRVEFIIIFFFSIIRRETRQRPSVAMPFVPAAPGGIRGDENFVRVY